MFDFLKKKIPLEVGQIWENKDKNPYSSKWRSEIISLKSGHVEYTTYCVDVEGNKFHELPSSYKTDSEKDFRFFNEILISC